MHLHQPLQATLKEILMDLLLDFNTNDLVFLNGPLTKEYTTQPFVQTVAQRLFILLRTIEGEWFLDLTHGVPYFDWLGRKVPKQRIDSVLQQEILAENGVKEITYFNSTFVNRVYSAQFRVRVSTGEETQIISITPVTQE
jgi:hypothetical protein